MYKNNVFELQTAEQVKRVSFGTTMGATMTLEDGTVVSMSDSEYSESGEYFPSFIMP